MEKLLQLNVQESPKWHIFYCKSRSEKKVLDILTKDNFIAYLPMIEVTRQWSDRIKKVNIPMISGYIFVHCFQSQIYQILQVQNIVSSVKIGKEYLYLRENEIEILRKVEQNNIFDSIKPIQISNGDKVIVIDGPLKGFEGICEQEMGKSYLLIVVDAIGQMIKVKIQSSFLQLAK